MLPYAVGWVQDISIVHLSVAGLWNRVNAVLTRKMVMIQRTFLMVLDMTHDAMDSYEKIQRRLLSAEKDSTQAIKRRETLKEGFCDPKLMLKEMVNLKNRYGCCPEGY